MENWKTTKIQLDNNKNEISRFHFKSYTNNSNGDIIDETEYDEDSNTTFKRIYRYFESGDVQEYIEFDPFEELLERHCYFKDDSDQIVRQEFEYTGGQKSIKEFFFTDIGNADKAIIRDEENTVTGYESFVYNNENQLFQEIEFDADNIEINKYEKFYFDNGLLRLGKLYQNGELITGEAFEYDNRGNVIKTILRDYVNNFEVINVFTFDKDDNMLYNSTHQNGVLVFENKCEYDNNNNLIKEEFFELDFWEKRILRHERLIHEQA